MPTKSNVKAESRAAGLPKPGALFGQALRDYRDNWKLLAGIILIVSLPAAILSNYFDPTGTSVLSAYVALAQFAMDLAVIYAVVAIVRGRSVGVRQAYYESSAMLVRSILVWALLILMALFVIVGAAILLYGVASPGSGVSLTAGEQALLTVLALVVSIPSIVLLVRGVWALYVVFDTPEGPIQAVAASRRLTQGRVWASLGRLLALAVGLLAVIILPAALLVILQIITHATAFIVLLQVVIGLLVIPLANLYLYRYYRALL